jgi:hypothetical protein
VKGEVDVGSVRVVGERRHVWGCGGGEGEGWDPSHAVMARP